MTILVKNCGPDLVIDIGTIVLGKKTRANMKDHQQKKEQVAKVLKGVCAAQNAGGGVVKAKIENAGYNFRNDGLGQDLENSLTEFLSFVEKYLKFTQKDDYFFLCVKSRHLNISGLRIGTLATNLYKRNITSVSLMSDADVQEFLIDVRKPERRIDLRPELLAPTTCAGIQEESHVEALASAFFDMTKLTHREKFSFTESTQVEFKNFSTKKLLQRTKEILPQYVSAFANTDGGYLFLGLDECTQEIRGFEAEESDLAKLESKIQECISGLPVYHVCKEKEKISYTCKFIEVCADGEGNIRRYVCGIRVERFCCLVFAKEPDSWHVEDNRVEQITTEEWIKLITEATTGFPKSPEKLTLQSTMPPSICVLPEKVTCTPENFCKEVFSQHERLEQLLHKEMLSLSQGVLIVSKSWSLDLGLQENQEVICDGLLISQDRVPVLYTFVGVDEGYFLNESGCKLILF